MARVGTDGAGSRGSAHDATKIIPDVLFDAGQGSGAKVSSLVGVCGLGIGRGAKESDEEISSGVGRGDTGVASPIDAVVVRKRSTSDAGIFDVGGDSSRKTRRDIELELVVVGAVDVDTNGGAVGVARSRGSKVVARGSGHGLTNA